MPTRLGFAYRITYTNKGPINSSEFLHKQMPTCLPYGGTIWRVQTLAKWQRKHHWQNKLWRIDNENLIKCILKQFEDTSAPYLSIRIHACCLKMMSNGCCHFQYNLRLEAIMKGTGVQKGTGKSTRFVVSYQNVQVKWW